MAGVAGDHDVWVSLQGGDEVAKLDRESGEWSFYAWPWRGTGLRNLAVVQRAGHLEVIGAYFNANRIGRMVMRTRAEVQQDAFSVPPTTPASVGGRQPVIRPLICREISQGREGLRVHPS